ncbi:MAG TPA: cytochrome c5 family protein [Gammaproteobacteria bacterium]|nr:cytochrome c5 family protein [Gammaproteobacteria bacterium]
MLGLVSQPVLAEDGLDARQAAKILENIRPVGQVNVGGASAQAQTAAPAPAAASARSGADVYNGACMACHGTGAAGAPKVGDKAAWGPRAEMGVDGLLKSAVSGLNAMPPRGTCGDCSDDELKAAIEHMLKETGLL